MAINANCCSQLAGWMTEDAICIFSSPVRRTESYSDTPRRERQRQRERERENVKVFDASYFFLSNVFIYHTIFYMPDIYIYRGVLCDTGRPSVRLSVCPSVRPFLFAL